MTPRQRVLASIVAVQLGFVPPSGALGQSFSEPQPEMASQVAWSRAYHAHTTPGSQARSSQDSVTNGAILGALVGAATFGAFGTLICRIEHEPGVGSCLSDSLRVAALGAAIGLGGGLAIDAMLSTAPGVLVRFGIKF